MTRCSVMLLLSLAAALAAGPAAQPSIVSSDVRDEVSPRPTQSQAVPGVGSFMDPPDTVWTLNVQPETVYQVGVTDVQDSLMWVSAGQVSLKIYIYNIADPSHPLRGSFAQTGGPSGWGIRDMAYDPATDHVFAGFDASRFHVYNATTHVPAATYTIAGYSGTVRAMAHNPVEDSLWTASFAQTPMTKFSITGTNGHEVRPAANMGACYGLAWDPLQNCFWMTQAGGAGVSPMWKIDYPGYTVSDSFNPSGWQQGGGCEMWRDTFLLALEQGTPDRVWCFKFNLTPPPDHDIALTGIVAPARYVNPELITPTVTIRNSGLSPESGIPVACWIDSAGMRVYDYNTVFPGPLDPNMSIDVPIAPDWTPGPAGNTYQVTCFSSLPGDQNPTNDTMAQETYVSGALLADTLVVMLTAADAPVIDGVINPPEWLASNQYDISDLLGRSGVPAPLGSNIAYYMYDGAFMYYAMDCPFATSRIDYDQFGPYMDEDRSGTWSTDSSEGNYWMEYVGADSAVYRALLNTVPQVWVMGQAPDAQLASSLASGHLQFEAKVPFGSRKSDYSVGPGATVGYFQYTAVDGGTSFAGWWPQTMSSTQWANPAYYGTMVFYVAPGVEQATGPVSRSVLYRVPSPVRGTCRINYHLAAPSEVTLGVYDVAGKLVRLLENSSMTAGLHCAAWDRTSTSGERVAGGTYFVRFAAASQTTTAKLVLLD